MTKNIPVPVKMAQEVLKDLREHPDFDILKKKLPAFALQYAENRELTIETLSTIASQGIDALIVEKDNVKPEKTYQSVIQNLPTKADETTEEVPRHINIRDIIKDTFYPTLTPYIVQFITAWERLNHQDMETALHELDAAIQPCNKDIMEMEGTYEFHQLSTEKLLRDVEEGDICVISNLSKYAANGDLEHLKLFHSVVPDMQVPFFTIPVAAYNTQIEVMDFYFKELGYDYPMHIDDYHSEDFIIKKVLEQENLETFQYLIDNGYSSYSSVGSKEVLSNPEFFDYGFEYMHRTNRPPPGYLRDVVKYGTFEQVKQIVEAGRYFANGDVKDQDDQEFYYSRNPMPHALYEAKNTEMFSYLRANSPEDLDQEDIQHTMSMLMLGREFKIANFLYETYPNAFTTEFLNKEFRTVSRNIFNGNNEEATLEFSETTPCYFLKQFGTMLDKSVLDDIVCGYFHRTYEKINLFEEVLGVYPYDAQDIWDRISTGIEQDPSLSDIEKLESYGIKAISNKTYLTLREKISDYQMGKAQIGSIIKMMDQTTPAATAAEWQDTIKKLCSYHRPIFDDIIHHLETHPLKDDVFTIHFAKSIVVKGIGADEYGSFDLVEQVIGHCPAVNDDEFITYAKSDTELDQTEKFIEKRQKKISWSKQHPEAPYSLLDFSPFYHQPKTFDKLVDVFENEEELGRETAEKYAYQVAGLFGSMSRVLTYLEKWGQATKQPLHDIVHSLKLPQTGRFNKAAWGDAVIKHGPKMAEMVHFANRMQQPEKSSDGKTWSYQKTFERASEFVYTNSDKAPELAKLCHGLQMSEGSFENARKIVDKFNLRSQKKGPQANQNIPQIEIDGSRFGKTGYKFMRLETGDLRGLFLGAMTGCCQWIGGIGSDCAEHGFKSPNGGFYVITNPDNQIVSQAWAWRGRKGEIVLDSIETLGSHVGTNEWQSICTQMANDFTQNYKDIKALHIGTGGQTPNLGYPETKAAKPVDKLGYSDADNQVAVWKRSRQIKAVF